MGRSVTFTPLSPDILINYFNYDITMSLATEVTGQIINANHRFTKFGVRNHLDFSPFTPLSPDTLINYFL